MIVRDMRIRPALLIAAALAIIPTAVSAGCVLSDLVGGDARAAAIRPETPRTRFVQDDALAPGCPSEKPACQQKAFLVPGDVVLTGQVQGAYTCSGFAAGKGALTIGWLPSAALAPLPEAEHAPSDWAGHWIAPEQDLTIAPARGDTLSVKGDATWGDTPERRRSGGVHIGEVAGVMRPKDGVLAFAMGDDDKTLPYEAGDEFTCRIRMVRRGPYLVARDNKACGGANVSFSGLYRREK